MLRTACVLIVLCISLRGHAQPAPRSDDEEIAQLEQQILKLHREGKDKEAAPLVNRLSALRIKAEVAKRQQAASDDEPVDLAQLQQQINKAYMEGNHEEAKRLTTVLQHKLAQDFKTRDPKQLLERTQKTVGQLMPAVARVPDIEEFAAVIEDKTPRLHPDAPRSPRKLAGALRASPPATDDPADSEAQQVDNRLARLYQQGKPAEAAPLFEQLFALRQKALQRKFTAAGFDPDAVAASYPSQRAAHAAYAALVNDFAQLKRIQASYQAARPPADRALDAWDRALAPPPPRDIASRSKDARLRPGSDTAFEDRYAATIERLAQAHGASSPEVATALEDVAELYRARGAYAKAEPLYLRAIRIWETVLGPTHRDVAADVRSLAEIYEEQGALAKAEPLRARALGIWEKQGAPAETAAALSSLALVHADRGAYAKAESLLGRALDLLDRVPPSPALVACLGNLAEIQQAQGAHDKAMRSLARAVDVREQLLQRDLRGLPEWRKRVAMAVVQGETERVISLQAESMPTSAPAIELALTTVLRRKGRVLDSLTENQTSLRGHLTPMLRRQLDELALARTKLVVDQYAVSYDGGLDASKLSPQLRSAKDPAAMMDALRPMMDWTIASWSMAARSAELDAALASASTAFQTSAPPVSIASVQAALPSTAALVELVRYHRFDARKPRQPWGEERYVAYLVTAKAAPSSVMLGDAAAIDAAIDAVLAEMHENRKPERAKAALRKLDALVLAPLRARLPTVAHLVVAPDGKLALAPFEALVDPDGHYALEQQLISYATSGRDLLRLDARQAPRSPGAMIANPAFGPGASPRGLQLPDALPGTGTEACELAPYFPAPLTGARATKAALQALTGPALLHIATHGAYLRFGQLLQPSTPAAVPVAQRGMSVERDPAEGPGSALLALAGAKQGAQGLLSDAEIAGLDWRGTQLVVLSACVTGVGDAPSGDGVSGLRRALVLAGTAAQVVTLWNVNDETAPELMRRFYGELARGTGRAEALRQAKLQLLREPGFEHPYYWAPYVEAGDWRPLDGKALAQTRASRAKPRCAQPSTPRAR